MLHQETTKRASSDKVKERKVHLNYDAAGAERMIPLSACFVETSYGAQRELKPHRVREIIADWDIRAAKHLIVSERDGRFAILDGQNTAEALRTLGYLKARCVVHSGLTMKDERNLFLRLNNQKQVATADKFAAKAANDVPGFRDIAQIAQNHGYEVSARSKTSAISGTAPLQAIRDNSGNFDLDATLRLCRRGWSDRKLTGLEVEAVAYCEYAIRDEGIEDKFVEHMTNHLKKNVLKKEMTIRGHAHLRSRFRARFLAEIMLDNCRSTGLWIKNSNVHARIIDRVRKSPLLAQSH